MTKRRALLPVVLAFVSAALPCAAGNPDFSLNGVKFNFALLPGLPVPTGLDVGARFPLGADGLGLTFRLAAGFEDRMTLRDGVTGMPIAAPDKPDGEHWFNWPNAQAAVGISFSPRKAALGSMGIDAFFSAIGRWEKNSAGMPISLFPDAGGLFAFSFIGGAAVDNVESAAGGSLRGYGGEVSLEYAPKAFGLLGGTDFARLSAFAEGYLPLWSGGGEGGSAYSLYAAGYARIDAAWGGDIPLYVLSSFGGRDLRKGLGHSVRGFQDWGYEARLKGVASAELRFLGPALFGHAALRPMAYLFADAGAYAGLYESTLPETGGFIASAGAGAALGISDVACVGLRAGFRMPVSDPLYPVYYPAGGLFFWSVSFLLHF